MATTTSVRSAQNEIDVRKSTRNQRINSGAILFVLVTVSIVVLWPIVHMLAAAFTPGQSIAQMPVVPFTAGLTTDHFVHLFQNTNYLLWFKNTFIIAAATAIGTLVLASLGAYVFSRFTFTFKKSFMMSLLILNVFPSFVGMVAIFVILLRIGGLDTLWGLVLVYLAGNLPFTTWMVKSYMDNVPRELDEAARIDGASSFRIWARIIVPVCKPILVFLGITSFVTPWMDFIFPRMVLRSPENQTIALGLFSFVTDRNNFFTTFAAGSLIVAVPFIIFFILTQKMLVSSLAGAAVKG
ncbi:binding-protein-dependent transport systems inner membrane component [Xylanimonas cellulosilytica DSM 15894]|uniref:Binding-protein-dependent transport systems inner membrane component n=1 Tax=Xylanimonas cellulosilytica (strain DSM 15894 / JCM 12276 / CECT 5975 / KCTC 9989 / LMG 20990 / NBRC 107835 / XIL07) TaxID=446471 RepID=D1BUF9_XYLCX|nr:ABC transporter permease subunit [Xylanimonas cellulosilytica]ACZ31172.1 binding-protein-dependent transport systems inner membrane component [Xylanimonas cellulosilytica DSM 15894]